ncbi:glycosyltransferase involved in cell wall biosynthesis [Gramella sp. Hel_I_59]|uniref:glycosyltransferase family 4 protein n=1 Tax=Gramella sp. Hel_I_59 TaxID=1249978 RepID=UPI00114ECD5B|nr:glycosyltransferase family 4 protein [Gramella sp. Hel_I_59]TQI71525.1 glycosyltransferase involved in cell wall biosynthesis [Gramella sp. Hel_I_59]
MHIAFLTPEYPHKLSTASGGLGTSIQNVANALIKYNIQVSIFVYGQKQSLVVEEDGINFHFIAQQKYPVLGWYFYRKYLQKYINNSILADQIDLLEVPDWTGISALMEIECPVVMRLNGSDAYFCHLEGRKQKFKNRFFEKKAFKNADAIISVSDFTGKTTNNVFRVKNEYTVIPNSVDANIFLPSTSLIKENTILYFGTIIRKKGVLELAEIFNHIVVKKPESRLILVGRDVVDILERNSTFKLFKEKLTEEAKEKIHFLGVIPYREIAEEIKKASVVVLPSFAEALPMTWLEAMAMEKAMVTSNIGWAQEVMIDGETGYTLNPKRHLEYADKIIQLIENPRLRLEFGRNARKRILHKFDAQVVADKNIKFFEDILKNSN